MTDQLAPQPQLTLPSSVVSKLEVSRLVHEVEQIDADFTTVSARAKAGVATQWQPVFSSPLEDFLVLNPVDMRDSQQRRQLIQHLRTLKETAPVVHMTFAAAADRQSLQEIADWLRSKVHPQAVVSVGLQPDLVGGVYIRTPNHVHDLSLRARLAGHRHVITQQVEALRGDR